MIFYKLKHLIKNCNVYRQVIVSFLILAPSLLATFLGDIVAYPIKKKHTMNKNTRTHVFPLQITMHTDLGQVCDARVNKSGTHWITRNSKICWQVKESFYIFYS